MDGFQALKQMLVLIHPLLNNQRPPTKAPTYLDTGDLHLYEQKLRNFYLLHKIYGRSDYSELDMSRQFLEGLDGDEYDAERTRLMAIIDGVELNNTGFQPKHRLDCLASTIMNMKNKHNSSKVQINAFSKARLYQKGHQYNSPTARKDHLNNRKNTYDLHRGTGFQFKTTHEQDKHKKYSYRSPATPKFSKGQCAACKIYGHHVKDCRLIAPHTAMGNFVKQNPQTYADILNRDRKSVV